MYWIVLHAVADVVAEQTTCAQLADSSCRCATTCMRTDAYL